MNDDYAFEILDRVLAIARRVAYENANPVERAIWIGRALEGKKFALIADELKLNQAYVRRTWLRFIDRIMDDVRFAMMADEELRSAFGSALADRDKLSSILSGMLALEYPPRRR